MDLELEKISRDSEGFTITNTRVKQRSEKKTTKFLVPQMGGYANHLAVYLDKVKSQLDRFKERVWFTRKKNKMLGQFIGKNSLSKVPRENAALLKLPDPSR
jgi:L-2-hydroxyglutarate oxidase LhgO